MSQKSILITGCATGIGYDAAHGLRDAGWRVFASCRQAADCERLSKEGFDSPQLDYEDPESISATLAQVLQTTGGTLDAVYHNGAYAIPGAIEDLPREALSAIFQANLIGWHDLNQQVIPVMRAQGHGRIVHCSSVLGLVATPWRGAYNATKFALEGYCDTLRMEMRDMDIEIVLIEPGPITSEFRRKAAKQFEKWVDWEAGARAEQYRNSLLKRLYRDEGPDRFELPPSAVTKKLLTALTVAHPKPRYFVTTPTYAMNIARRILPDRWLDAILSRG